RVLNVDVVDAQFHARYSAIEKTYIYRIANTPVASPFCVRYTFQEARPLDLDRMRSAAHLFLGRHDWTAFSAAASDVEDRVRTITSLDVGEYYNERVAARIVDMR